MRRKNLFIRNNEEDYFMFCKNCGKEIDEQAAFCVYCGGATNMVPQVKKTAFCRNCGNEIDGGATFCNRCGLATDKFQEVQFPQKEEDAITGGLIALCILVAYAGLVYGIQVKKDKPNTGRSCITISIISICVTSILSIIFTIIANVV